MKYHGYVWVQVYKDTTPFDNGRDDNLLDVQVKESVLHKYMEKNGLGDEWLETYTADDTMDFYEFAKNDIVDTQPVGWQGGKVMKFERLKHIPGGEHDWYFQIGDTIGEKAFCILLRYFTGRGFRLIINFYRDELINLFGFQREIGV